MDDPVEVMNSTFARGKAVFAVECLLHTGGDVIIVPEANGEVVDPTSTYVFDCNTHVLQSVFGITDIHKGTFDFHIGNGRDTGNEHGESVVVWINILSVFAPSGEFHGTHSGAFAVAEGIVEVLARA